MNIQKNVSGHGVQWHHNGDHHRIIIDLTEKVKEHFYIFPVRARYRQHRPMSCVQRYRRFPRRIHLRSDGILLMWDYGLSPNFFYKRGCIQVAWCSSHQLTWMLMCTLIDLNRLRTARNSKPNKHFHKKSHPYSLMFGWNCVRLWTEIWIMEVKWAFMFRRSTHLK